MDAPFMKPRSVVLGVEPDSTPASPSKKRRHRPGWKATIVRSATFSQLRAIQKSTSDPAIDLSYLMDACVQMALDVGAEAIVSRALDGIRLNRASR